MFSEAKGSLIVVTDAGVYKAKLQRKLAYLHTQTQVAGTAPLTFTGIGAG